MKELQLGFGRAYAPEPGVVVVETAAHVHVTAPEGERGWRLYRTLHEGDYVVIIDRVNVYSLDLVLWRSISNDPRLRAVIVVAYRPLTRSTAEQLERHFIQKPMHVTHSMEQAVDLARTYLPPMEAQAPHPVSMARERVGTPHLQA